jgi:hypothetical protein
VAARIIARSAGSASHWAIYAIPHQIFGLTPPERHEIRSRLGENRANAMKMRIECREYLALLK